MGQKKKVKIGLVFLMSIILSVVLVGCGSSEKSLEKKLLEGTATWQAVVSDGEGFKITFFEDGNASVLEDGGSVSDEGKYAIKGNSIQFLGEDDEVLNSIEDVKTQKNTVNGMMVNKNSDEKKSVIMTQK
ncbi:MULTISPECIES: hypothetical protein [Vagococcus]|uniref:Lipoprotein n=1 Tax=Vagococcus fluvialis bH819 TaxID=1255619 RepID=A0A1X6WS44_9ENTE|nr:MULTISPECIES: hypothetical protein [Vagococcus]SLM87069.1 hypothetical protein FM121_13305 [Vagococcus fluvialis bH819]HCM90585.1 hypothetical protein [Vagococcus sp.]